MRPIKLVIKGLNSFIEEQTIDFNKLTDRGLFGIFGPTGSGKSTILDGITLALYGDIARKSSNFINTNCNDLNVSFTFQISGMPNHIYVVSRHFKRDKKTGNAKTHSAMVKEITNGEEVLADSVKQVTETCKKILGLSLEDFTRTVVLPQGKFSEFLKLEGKQRREMLERLFNLQDYGDKLALKLSKEMNSKRDEFNRLTGEMNNYEEITDERLEQEKAYLSEVTGTLEAVRKEQEQVEARYKKGEEIWKMQNELASFKLRQAQLQKEADRIEAQSRKVKQAESAQRVYPILESYETTKLELGKTQEAHEALQVTQKGLEIKKQEISQAYEAALKEKNEVLPELQNKALHLQEVMSEVIALEETEAFIKKVEDGLVLVTSKLEEAKEKEKAVSEQIEQAQSAITKLQQDEKAFKVDETIRIKVQEGLRLTELYKVDKKHLDKNEEEYKDNAAKKIEIEKQMLQIKKQLQEKNNQLEKQLEMQTTHLKQVPMSKEELLQKQEKLAVAREKDARIEKLKLELSTHEVQLKEIETEKEKLSKVFKEKEALLNEAKEQYDSAKLQNLAHLLRAKLQEGKACPVCGSTTHHLEDLQQGENAELNSLEAKVKELEESYKRAEKALSELQVSERAETTQVQRLQEEIGLLIETFKEQSLEQMEKAFKTSNDALNEYEAKKEELEKGIISLKDEKSQLETEMAQKDTQLIEKQRVLSKLQEEISETKETIAKNEEALNDLMDEANTKDFTALSEQILDKDRKREELALTIQKKTEEKEKLTTYKGQVVEYINSKQVQLGSGITKFDESQKKKESLLASINRRLVTILKVKEQEHQRVQTSIEEIINFLKTEVTLVALLKGKAYQSINQNGENQDTSLVIHQEMLEKWFNEYPILGACIGKLKLQLETLKNVVGETSINIEEKFTQTKTQKEQVDTEFETVNKELVGVIAKLEDYTKRFKAEKASLENKLKEEELTEREVKEFLLTKEALQALKDEIQAYQDEKSKLAGSVEAITNKLGNQKLEENEWLDVQKEKEQISARVEEINKQYINLSTLVKQIETALVKLGKLREKKQQLEERIGILSDLEKLFKGKKFVEFVAAERLKYVSLEASKKLREISNGNYGLEVDADGKFIIRDYKNGGAQRDASTLSGGETFLASLALALALSAEIQLKGTAPLELFFLDEGFGTLDDDLLDVVMSSLERIHHEKLKVGIISHVEAIKNRVPVKLILTPAEAGKGGTKVKLERS